MLRKLCVHYEVHIFIAAMDQTYTSFPRLAKPFYFLTRTQAAIQRSNSRKSSSSQSGSLTVTGSPWL